MADTTSPPLDLDHTPDGIPPSLHVNEAGGSNLKRVRAHNERLVLSLLRARPQARADLARQSGLSAQTISLIVRALEADGLICSGKPVKGRVGQPSVPLSLDPAGAWFAGLQIGRLGAQLALMDFGGCITRQADITYRWPDQDQVIAFVRREWAELVRGVDASRLHGIGIALPFGPWQWPERLGAPQDVGERWRERDISFELAQVTGLPALTANDATAACGAELTFGNGRAYRDFAYLFVAQFIGGGLVLDSQVHGGRLGNAGAFGSLPVPDANQPGQLIQLIDAASLHVLETAIDQRAREASASRRDVALRDADSPLWSDHPELVAQWEERASEALAIAATAIASVVEIEAVVIDGVMPERVRASLSAQTSLALERVDTRGIEPPAILSGSIGPSARTLGAARLPLFDRFLLDQGVLTRSG